MLLLKLASSDISKHISDDLYFPNRPILKYYISSANENHESTSESNLMAPPAGDDVHQYIESTLSSLNPLYQSNINTYDEWLLLDSNNGYIRLYDPQDASTSYSRSKLIQCRISTTVEQICAKLNNDLNPHTWYVQFHGDRIRPLKPDERPLYIQYDYLLSIGFSSICRLQQEGDKHDLGYLIRFLSGKNQYWHLFSRATKLRNEK